MGGWLEHSTSHSLHSSYLLSKVHNVQETQKKRVEDEQTKKLTCEPIHFVNTIKRAHQLVGKHCCASDKLLPCRLFS